MEIKVGDLVIYKYKQEVSTTGRQQDIIVKHLLTFAIIVSITNTESVDGTEMYYLTDRQAIVKKEDIISKVITTQE